MDDADRAQGHIEAELERRIAAARGVVKQSTVSNEFCDECGDEIPRARRLAVPGCTHCAPCASDLERADGAARRAGL